MSYQNVNQYNFNKIGFRPVNEIIDISLASDELNFDEETVFSSKLIAENDGNRMPFSFDLNSQETSICINCGVFSSDIIVSTNYYNPYNENLFTNQNLFNLCDVGLTSVDNGLVQGLTGETIEINSGLYTGSTNIYNRYKYDRRLKLHPITGFTTTTNRIYLDNSYNYNITEQTEPSVGRYAKLNGGFYQGFYRLAGYDYEIFPERVNLGWTAEFLLRYRWTGDTYNGLNARYTGNTGTFFYLGTRAENKFYHYANGEVTGITNYNKVTSGLTCLDTCGCNSINTKSSCNKVYPLSGSSDSEVILLEKNVLYDGASNGLSLQLSGNTGNPILCVKSYVLTGSCETTGYTINQWCSTKGVFNDFRNTTYISKENWIQIDAVFVRDRLLDTCDLKDLGGLGLIVNSEFTATTMNKSISLIEPPHTSGYTPTSIEVVNFDSRWFEGGKYRNGHLRIYINGRIFFIVDNFEEIIPRQLDTIKERQIGVPFNISIGGGTQGLHDSLTFSSCTGNAKIQDPQLLPTKILNKTQYSGLTTNILLEEIFGGSFIGDFSAFRMYTEPLDAGKVRHNFNLLKNRYKLVDFFNPDKGPAVPATPTVTPTNTPTMTITPTMTPTISISASVQVSPTPTPTPSNLPFYAYVFAEPQLYNDGINLENYMLNNSATWGGYQFYGVPNTSNYSTNLNIYAHYSGWTSNSGNYITNPTSLSAIIKQSSGTGIDPFGCPQNQYSFGTIKIAETNVNTNIQYFYSIWIPLGGVGNSLTNMAIDAGSNPCLSDYVNNGKPDEIITQNVTITSGAAIPAGVYRVLWLPILYLPITIPLRNSIYIKGEINY
jgi:hypothetical protein